MKKIVILGSNFAGLDVARELHKENCDLTIIDKKDTFEFYPGAHKLVSKDEKFSNLSIDLTEIYSRKNIKFINDEVKKIDYKKKTVTLTDQKIKYDYLVDAMGSVAEFHNVKGAQKYSIPFKTIQDSLNIKNKIIELTKKNKKFNVVIAGSGLTGLELLFEIKSLISKLNSKGEITLLEAQNTVCPWTNIKTQKYIEKLIKKDDIILKEGFLIKEVKKDSIVNTQNQIIKYDMLIWCAGIRVNPVIEESGLKYDRFGLVVDDYLRSITDKHVFACGDSLSKCTDNLCQIPKTAQYAEKESQIVITNLKAKLNQGKKLKYVQAKHAPVLIDLGDHGAILMYKNILLKNPGFFYEWLKEVIKKYWIKSRRR